MEMVAKQIDLAMRLFMRSFSVSNTLFQCVRGHYFSSHGHKLHPLLTQVTPLADSFSVSNDLSVCPTLSHTHTHTGDGDGGEADRPGHAPLHAHEGGHDPGESVCVRE